MADLATILKDPNFVNANDVTKQAIFDKWAPQDPNFANANTATQDAIRQKFGLTIAAPAISNEEAVFGKSTSKAERKLGMGEQIMSLPLTAATVLSSGPAFLAGAWGEALGGKATGEKVRKALTFPTYTEAQQRQLESLGGAMEAAHLPPTLGGVGIPLNALAAPATSQAMNTLSKVAKAPVPMGATVEQQAATKAIKQSEKAWQRAPQIEAAQKAPEYGIALNPARSNPTVGTKLGVGSVGEGGVNYELSQKNLPKWNEAARKDLGLPENTPLDEAALDKYMERNSTSKLVINKMGVLENNSPAIKELDGLMLDQRRTSDKAKFEAVNAVVDRAREQVAEGLTGSEVLDQIRGFRHDAKRVLQNPNAGPNEIEVANTKLKIAKTFEDLIEQNLTDDSVIDLYRKERTAQAKGYDWERAIDPITKQVDPNQLASDVRRGVKMTGALADLAEIAGTYPEIASMQSLVTADPYTALRRGGVGGTVGFSTLGGPAGAAVGAGITSLVGRLAAKKIATPTFQQKHAIPSDTRLPLPPVEGMSRPDFVMQGGVYSPVPPVPNKMIGYNPSAPSAAEAQMNRLRQEDVLQRGFDYRMAQQAEQQQAAAEAAARKPAGGEVILDINPLTGVPEISKGLKGATPATFQDFGTSLKSASEKVASGRNFDMDAAELAAWKRTTADLAEVMPGFKALDDKVLAERMMDRKWVADALEKSRQKAAMFDDIAKRAADQQAKMEAAAKREQLLDLADILEENLRGGRPVSKGGQGPKTRAHQRNMLSPEQETQNRLIIEISGVGQRK